jgi:protocatechuate 3,4-dioxygenase beta subunit
MSGPSSSYRDGAAPVASDGDELVIKLRFLRVEGRDCRTVPGVTAEIWHTGTSGYDPVLWRTALPVEDDGTVVYRTVRPSAVEGTPHVHVRVADFDERAYEWVFGVPQDGEETLEMQLLLVYVTETNPPPGVETPGV